MLSGLIEALQIFLKYGDLSRPTHCEHDVMFVCVSPSIVTEDDKRALAILGFIEDGSEGFKSYRYGSA